MNISSNFFIMTCSGYKRNLCSLQEVICSVCGICDFDGYWLLILDSCIVSSRKRLPKISNLRTIHSQQSFLNFLPLVSTRYQLTFFDRNIEWRPHLLVSKFLSRLFWCLDLWGPLGMIPSPICLFFRNYAYVWQR